MYGQRLISLLSILRRDVQYKLVTFLPHGSGEKPSCSCGLSLTVENKYLKSTVYHMPYCARSCPRESKCA